MTTQDYTLPLKDMRLGDIVTLPDERSLTVRARTIMPNSVGTMAGFMVLGELDAILTTPARNGEFIGYYVPASSPTFDLEAPARQRAEGALRYWAPHLPPVASAMGELLYRVVEVHGAIDPHIVVYRSKEPIFFVRAAAIDPQHMQTSPLVGAENDSVIDRQSWTVIPRQIAPNYLPDDVSQQVSTDVWSAGDLYTRALGS